MAGRCPISIVVPVYNDEEKLAGCIDSILSQKPSDFEVIIVNNGSTDSTVDLCEIYREKDQRVGVVHMDHDTPATAYNKGLQAATGKYVHFIDAGDRIADNALENISDLLLSNLDVIFLETSHPNFWDISYANILRRLSQDIPARLWDKLIRRELLVQEDILFAKGIVWESVDFCMKLYLHARTYGAVDFPYCLRHAEALDRDTEGIFGKIILTLTKWAGPAETIYAENSTIVHAWMAAMYCDLLIPMFSQLPPGARKVYKPGMNDFQWLLDVRKRGRTLKVLYALLGPLGVSYLLGLAKRLDS